MLAIHFENEQVVMAELPRPQPAPGEALLRVRTAGICNTDLELLRGYYGFSGVAGHEFVAVVEQADDRPELVGQRVVADINCGCGTCALCLAGDPRHCPGRTVTGIVGRQGAFAEMLAVPIDTLREVPAGVADDEAVFAEPLAAALEIGQQLHLSARTRLLVLGDGKLGSLIALGLRHAVPGLVLAGRHQSKLSVVAAQGVATLLMPRGTPPAEIASTTGTFDTVVEVTGRADGLAAALEFVRPEGLIVLKTTSRDPVPMDGARIVVDEITIVGSRCGDISLALHYLKERLVDVRPLVEGRYTLSDSEAAFAHAGRSGAKKVLIDFPRAAS